MPSIKSILVVCGLSLALAAPAQEPNPIAKVLTTKTAAFAIFPPELVLPGYVTQFEVSPDGRYIAAVSTPVPRTATALFLTEADFQSRSFPSEHRIEIYDCLRKQAFTLLTIKPKEMIGFDVQWTREPGVAILVADRPKPVGEEIEVETEVLRLSAADRQVRSLGRFGKENLGVGVRVMAAPGAATIFVFGYDLGTKEHRFLRMDTNGRVTGQMKAQVPGYISVSDWTADGKAPLWFQAGQRQQCAATFTRRPTIVVLDIDRQQLTFTEETLATWRPTPPAELLGFQEGTHELVQQGTRERVSGLWLEAADPGEVPRVFLDTHANSPKISPDQTYIAYISNGGLYTRAVIPVSLSDYRTFEAMSQQRKAMQQAKVIGTAVNIYMADNNDQIPAASSWAAALSPYLNDQAVMQGFIYVHPGGPIDHTKSPMQTVIGYVETPTGRAVVYLDSSVRWEPKK